VYHGRNEDHEHRQRLAAFLERLGTGEVDAEQWQRLIVNHYFDETLERVRREVARLRIQNEAMRWSPEEKGRIDAWVREIRATAV